MKTCSILFITIIAVAFSSCKNRQEHAHETSIKYTCSMHPQIIQNKPGTCPICGMELVQMNARGNNDGSIMLSESQIKLGNITTTLARYQDIGSTTILNGNLAVNEDKTEVISSRVKGRIEKLYFKEIGQRVKQGEPLYEIYSEELLTLQQEYLLALRQNEELGVAEKRYGGFLKTSERKLILLGMTKIQIEKIAKRKSVESKITFNAPSTGVISRIDVIEGQYIEEGNPLYRIENLDHLWVEAELYSGETDLISPGDSVTIKVSGFENKPVKGKITFISPELKGSQILTLRALITNSDHLFLPGMQAIIELVEIKKKVIALPSDAVIRDAKGNHVWVLSKDGAFTPRKVFIGVDNFDKVEIRRGLNENENVVITGAYLLYSELVLKKGGDPMATHHH